jgi:predicted small lipoprotein YifL
MSRRVEQLLLLVLSLAVALVWWAEPASSTETSASLSLADPTSDSLVAPGEEGPLELPDSEPGPASPDEEPKDDSDSSDDTDEEKKFLERSAGTGLRGNGERVEPLSHGLSSATGTPRRRFKPPRA